jgi:two-component system LytT family response regulator
MIHTLIIESNLEIRRAILKIIDKYFDHFQVVESVANIDSGMQAILKHQPDLVITETNLPDGSAFEMLECLTHRDFEIIVLSVNPEEALRAIRVHAFDYVTMPLNTPEFVKILIKLILEIEKKKMKFSYCQQCPVMNKENSTLVIHTLTDIHVIQPKDILYCRSEGSYTHLYLTNKSTILFSKNLKEVEKQLDNHHFVRVHHSHLVNMQHVVKFKKTDGGMIFLSDGSQIPVSVRKKADLFRLLETTPQH